MPENNKCGGKSALVCEWSQKNQDTVIRRFSLSAPKISVRRAANTETHSVLWTQGSWLWCEERCKRINDETHSCLLLHKYRHPPKRNHEATTRVGRVDGVKSARLQSCI
jgi:hypothetical protein